MLFTTRHESRPLLWRGMGRLSRGMGGMGRPEPLSAHHPHQQQGLSGFHGTRDPSPEARLLPGARREPARIPRFSRNTNQHETRITAFVVARHGAAMARHGRHGAPRAALRAPSAPATAPFGFSRNTRPETRLLPGAPRKPARIPRFSRNTNHGFLVFPCPSGDSKESNPKPDQRVFHETRITNHGLYASLPTISHDFPAFPGPPHPPIKCPGAVRRNSHRPPGCLRSGESPMSHAEKGERSGLRCQASACGDGLDRRYNFARKQGRV